MQRWEHCSFDLHNQYHLAFYRPDGFEAIELKDSGRDGNDPRKRDELRARTVAELGADGWELVSAFAYTAGYNTSTGFSRGLPHDWRTLVQEASGGMSKQPMDVNFREELQKWAERFEPPMQPSSLSSMKPQYEEAGSAPVRMTVHW